MDKIENTPYLTIVILLGLLVIWFIYQMIFGDNS